MLVNQRASGSLLYARRYRATSFVSINTNSKRCFCTPFRHGNPAFTVFLHVRFSLHCLTTLMSDYLDLRYGTMVLFCLTSRIVMIQIVLCIRVLLVVSSIVPGLLSFNNGGKAKQKVKQRPNPRHHHDCRLYNSVGCLVGLVDGWAALE